MEEVTTDSLLISLQDLVNALSNGDDLDLIIQRLDSLVLRIECTAQGQPWTINALTTLSQVTSLLIQEQEGQSLPKPGRPKINIPVEDIEFLLSLRFKVVDIAKIYKVSRDTIAARLREAGILASDSYSNMTDDELYSNIREVLSNFPSTGYKRMKGYLLSRGIKVPDKRVRLAMKEIDPDGVSLRARSNRAIVRRVYRMTYFNELWHLDTNMKLIRWNIIIRSCIDGKSRVVVYLGASADNTSQTNLASFANAVSKYGIPSRTRSDKGGENVSIAQFMIEHRGTGRASHICGRSVHNQRIERYWRDVYYGYTGTLASVFVALEEDGYLHIDNPKHVQLLHLVFLDRMNDALETFRNAWNNHPLSSESNYTPNQLMLLHLPPEGYSKSISEAELDDYFCNEISDVNFVGNTDDSIVSPMSLVGSLSEIELARLRQIDFTRPSSSFGYDIYVQSLSLLDPTLHF